MITPSLRSLVALGVLLHASPPAAPLAKSQASTPREAVQEIARAVRMFNDSLAAARGLEGGWIGDDDQARTVRTQRSRDFVRALDGIDRRALQGTPEALLLLGLREGLSRQAGASICRDELWNVSPLGGAHLALAGALANAANDRSALDATLQRLRAFPAASRALIALLERGMREGITASRDNVDRVIEQLDVLTTQLSSATPGAVERSAQALAPSLGSATHALVADTLVAALARYRTFLVDAYRPRARTEGSLRAIPDGADCYRARLALLTGVDVAAESLAAVAAARRAAVDAELAPLLQRLVGRRPLAEAKRVLRTDARFLHRTREEMLREARALEARLTPATARLFRSPPATPLVIEPTPMVRERSDPPARYAPPQQPGEPGTFFLNTWRPDSQPRWNLAMAVAHEGAPGHHLERTYPRALLVPDAARSFGIVAYIEGWGMYAEELAARESGVLDDDLSRVGFLMHALDAWNGLELDVRMHLEGWTRDQVIDRTMEVTGKSRSVAAVYADRHASAPGQMASYMTGYHALRTMRDDAARILGSRFDVRDFHQRVLEAGPLPLPVIEDRVREWARQRP